MSVSLALICLLVGLLIGAVGIGGVLLVPALAFIAGIDVHEAIPACMLSFLITGLVGVLVYARHGSIRWRDLSWLCLGAVPAAFLGALSLDFIPPAAVIWFIVGLMVFAGIDALLKSRGGAAGAGRRERLSPAAYLVIGAITGYGSAISGTGGPLILVPLVLYLGLPVLVAVGLSQAIQVPIAVFASVGNWMSGNLNAGLGLTLGAFMLVGVAAGAQAVHYLPLEPLRRAIAGLLVGVGAALALRMLFQPG